MFYFDWMTQLEIDEVLNKCAFTDEQFRIFNLLLKNNCTDLGIMSNLKISNTRYYRHKRLIQDKINRILRDQRN